MNAMKWWQRAIFYQIYPRSFMDSSGNGLGDFPGMTSRLDYLEELGVDAVWLSPHYPSPFYDCGYDISNYRSVDPVYGTMDDFMHFLDEIHAREMHLVIDLVLNHTSEQHPWFIESRSSRENPRRDWYVWHDGHAGSPPNNWVSNFGGSAWEFDPLTEQYYYHHFFKQQPDLNWRNPEVKQAMWDRVRFWLDLGVDGFRLDAIGAIYEDPQLKDHTCPLTQEQIYRLSRDARRPQDHAEVTKYTDWLLENQLDQPEIHELMKELRSICDEYEERVLIGESEEISYYGSGEDELDLVFNFPLMKTDRISPEWVRNNQQQRLSALPPNAWPCNTFNNHDTPRSYNRYGDGKHDHELARLHLALLMTLRGTPFLYYGEEIGMRNLILEDISQFKDKLGVWFYNLEVELLGNPPRVAIENAASTSRDQCRTPMQWANLPGAGFTKSKINTWLPVNPNYANGVNVNDQERDPNSLLNFYQEMIQLRKRTPALVHGSYIPIHENANRYLAFMREADDQKCLVVLNMSEFELEISIDFKTESSSLVFSSHKPNEYALNISQLKLSPFEILVAELKTIE